jgi:predicted ArsR family transcriptional regulator
VQSKQNYAQEMQRPQRLSLRERVFAQLAIPGTSTVETLAKALDEPDVFVRFALEQLRAEGFVHRRGTWWSAVDESKRAG